MSLMYFSCGDSLYFFSPFTSVAAILGLSFPYLTYFILLYFNNISISHQDKRIVGVLDQLTCTLMSHFHIHAFECCLSIIWLKYYFVFNSYVHCFDWELNILQSCQKKDQSLTLKWVILCKLVFWWFLLSPLSWFTCFFMFLYLSFFFFPFFYFCGLAHCSCS